MKRNVFVLMAIFSVSSVIAESAPASYTIVLNNFVKFYNADQSDSVFRMFSPEMKAVLPLDKYTATTIQLKQQLGTLDKTDFVNYTAPVAVYKAKFKNASFLLNLALNNDDKITGLLLKPADEPVTAAAAPADESVTESPVVQKTLAGTLYGTLAMPKTVSGKIPVVLIIAGEGFTDRNGNNKAWGITSNPYQLLAYALAKEGIASLRYDKRMVGQSVTADKENQLRFEDYTDDATSLIGMLNDDGRFSKIILAGHGQGSLVGMMSVADEPVKGLITLEGASDPADKILTAEMKSKPAYLGEELKTMLDSLRKGKTSDNIDPTIYSIARPTIQPFLMSWCRYDPIRAIKKVEVPILIVQGTTDLQVSVTQGQHLKAAKSNATLNIIRGMNYVLRDAPLDQEQNLATYSKPDLPLNQEMVTAIVTFIKGLN